MIGSKLNQIKKAKSKEFIFYICFVQCNDILGSI